jgi:hypothetical protein
MYYLFPIYDMTETARTLATEVATFLIAHKCAHPYRGTYLLAYRTTHIKCIRRSVCLLSREAFKAGILRYVIAEVLETCETLNAFWTASGHIAEAPTHQVHGVSSMHVMAEAVIEERSQRNSASIYGIAGLPVC